MTKRTPRAPVAAILLALGTSAAVAQTTGSTPSQDRGMNNATAPDPRTPAASGKSDIGRPGFDANGSVRGSTGGATTDTLPGAARGSTQGSSTDMTTGADTSTVDKTKKTSSKKAKKSGTTSTRDRNRAQTTTGSTNASPSGATGNQGNPPTTGSTGGSSK